MSETLFAILTDASARQTSSARTSLEQEFSAGKGWFSAE
jgi:hypothetical protein